MREYANEAVNIIKDLIVNNELVKGDFISYIGSNEQSEIVVRDLLNHEVYYSLSEVSCIFTDYIDCIGYINKNAYNTVLNSKENNNYEQNKNHFMKSLSRLREIEQCV